MAGKPKPKPGGYAEVAFRDGQQATESLPLPVVYYPGHYGAFFAFSTLDAPSRLCLCSCAKPAVANFLALNANKRLHTYPHRVAPLDSGHFPLEIALRSLQATDPWSVLEFAPGICHRCNLARPSMNYCHPMYGGQFMQGFGWYVRQAFYRLGVEPRSKWTGSSNAGVTCLGHAALNMVCPDELLRLVNHERAAAMQYRQESDRLYAITSGPPRNDIRPDEVTYHQNVKLEEALDYIRLRRAAAQAERAITTFVENLVRQEFGFRNVGEGWVSEVLLSQLVSRLLPAHQVLRHHRPEWLEGLELDIYVPDLRLGIEYQGQQHFHAIEAWGGSTALARVQHNDGRKVELCRLAGVTLLTVDYTEPLMEDHVRSLLGNAISRGPA